MKRKAEEDLVSQRTAPFVRTDGSTAQFKGPAAPEPEDGVHDGSTVGSLDDGQTDQTDRAPSTTPVTTAVSTASRRFPSDLKTIKCTWPDCTKTFNRPARLTAHLRSHNNDRPFRCADCAKTYMEEKHLRQHIKGSHSQERRYVCEACSRAFLTATRLRRHAAVHEGQDRFRCRGHDAACTRTFRKHQTLQRHIRVDHLGQPAFACSRDIDGSASGCGALFESAGALRRHVAREHGTAKYWCEECLGEEDADSSTLPPKAGFATKVLLEAHMRQDHVSCLFCDVRCAGPAALHRHIDMYHSGKSLADRKTTVCPHDRCGKTFTRRANLNVHVRAVHEGLRFVCGDVDALNSLTGEDEQPGPEDPQLALWDARANGCGRGFVSKRKLEEHVRYVHLRHERPPPMVVTTPGNLLASDAGQPAPVALLDDLAGIRRTLACPLAGCAARFVRHHDLHVHQQQKHADTGLDIDGDPLLMLSSAGNDLGQDGLYLNTNPDPDDSSNMLDMYLDLGLTPPLEDGAVPADEGPNGRWTRLRCVVSSAIITTATTGF
ncbi:c2h2 transcription factor [Grosmannia clavigera kw1407]|uniref:C2h2 transcription factor n=1 Tax=Grosmannia clavigera (strain kw1407 / UAMH 11150) TaxID=655863 RepID=F0XQ94_GROCL|nr:c2h2 transcription factor [Grosmannia clavigera kw1407]EFX00727.1 c2h2 transcription factor [Grosmannia clavigera kw1407]